MKKGWALAKMSKIQISPMQDEDIEAIYAISKESLGTSWTLESLKMELNNKLARYVVAKLDNKVIGFGGIWIVLDEAQITNIAVHNNYRRLGTGELMLNSLISLCKTLNISDITLEVRKSNIKAINLYSKFGFLEEGLRKAYYSDNNEDAIIMWKRNI